MINDVVPPQDRPADYPNVQPESFSANDSEIKTAIIDVRVDFFGTLDKFIQGEDDHNFKFGGK
jgi:hypothetical protein